MKFIYTKADPTYKYTHPSDKTDTFDIKIHLAFLTLKRVHLYPSIEQEIVTKMSNGVAAKYFFRNQYIRNFQILKGQQIARIPDILLTSYYPDFALVFFLEEKDYKGNAHGTNFHFQPFDISNLYLKSGSDVFPKTGEFKPTITDDPNTCQIWREFFSLYSQSAGLNLKADYGLWVQPDWWSKSFAFFKFDFTRYNDTTLVNDTYIDQRSPCSNIDLHVQFAKQTPENLTVLVFTSSIESLSITSNSQGVRDVQLGYSL